MNLATVLADTVNAGSGIVLVLVVLLIICALIFILRR